MTEQKPQTTNSLADELNRLGENLGKVLKNAWASDERRSIEKELNSGLEQLVKRVNEAVESAQADATLNKAKAKAKEAWETARGPQIVGEMRTGIVDTLRKLNEDLAKRTTPPATPPPASEAAAEAPAEEQQ
ncbi:MAG: hypothetical protein K1X39_00025 [Thermoflexales bacterium]|nr:hypothetical protein [Thermoflexales bacterium]